MGRLDGRRILVTGGAAGLGREYAHELVAQGAAVAVNDLPGPALETVVADLAAAGGRAAACPGDVGDEACAQQVVDAAVAGLGGLDVLVNNAGNFREGPLTECGAADFDALVHVHLRGHFLMTRAAARHWRDRAAADGPVRASVVNTTSRSALLAVPNHAAYAMAKAAVVALTEVAAKELAGYGVRVNCVAPFARTAMTESITGLVSALEPPGGPGAFDPFAPANVAPLVAYLAEVDCPVSGRLLFGHGGVVQEYVPWSPAARTERDSRWTAAELARELPALLRVR